MEEVDYTLYNSSGYNINLKVLKLKLEAVFRSSRFAEEDAPSILICRAEVVCLSQNVASIDFQ